MKHRTIFTLGLAYLFLFLASLAVYFSGSHGDTVLVVNTHRTPFLDAIMPVWTHFGDGWFFATAVIAFLLIRWRSGLVFLLLGTLQLLVSALLKRVVFTGVPRPRVYFAELGIPLHFIEGVSVHGYHAFPSGHTMTAFGVAAFVTLFSRNIWVGWISLFMAVGAGFSRIYLLQHFLIDVAIGSLIGVILATSVYFVFRSMLASESRSLSIWKSLKHS